MDKKTILVIVFVTLCFRSLAQFGFGAQGAMTYNLRNVSVGSKDYNLNPAPCFGYGINAFYNINHGMFRISIDANYMAPAKAIYSKPDSLNTEIWVNSFNISPEFQYAFKGNFNSKGQVWYAFAGVDMNIYNYKVNAGTMEYDQYGYPILDPNTALPVYGYSSFSKTYTAFTPNIGIGLEWGINTQLHLFGQLKYSFGFKPSFNDIDQSDFTQLSMPESYNPSYFSLIIGIKYWPDPKIWK